MKNIAIIALVILPTLLAQAQNPSRRAQTLHKNAYDSFLVGVRHITERTQLKELQEVFVFLIKHTSPGLPTSLSLFPIVHSEKSSDCLLVPLLLEDSSIISQWSWTTVQAVPDALYIPTERAVLFQYPFSTNRFWNCIPAILWAYHARNDFYTKYSTNEHLEDEVRRQELFTKTVKTYFGRAYTEMFTQCVNDMQFEITRKGKKPGVYFPDPGFVSNLMGFGGVATSVSEVRYRREMTYRSVCFSLIENAYLDKKQAHRKKIVYLRARMERLGHL